MLYTILPKDYSKDKEYPLIVFLDGDWYYEFFQKEINKLIKHDQIPPCIVVGVGYPLDGGYKELCPHCSGKSSDINITRFRDYSFPKVDSWTIPTGEAANYSTFLNEELLPKIEAEYSIKTNEQYLMGHSLGGLSVFYNLFVNPNQKFDGFATLSASLYWAEGHTFSLEETYHQNNIDLPKKLYMAYGTAESGSLAVHNAEMISRIENRNYPSLQFEYEAFKGASHRQVSWEGFREGTIYLLNN